MNLRQGTAPGVPIRMNCLDPQPCCCRTAEGSRLRVWCQSAPWRRWDCGCPALNSLVCLYVIETTCTKALQHFPAQFRNAALRSFASGSANSSVIGASSDRNCADMEWLTVLADDGSIVLALKDDCISIAVFESGAVSGIELTKEQARLLAGAMLAHADKADGPLAPAACRAR